MFYFRNIQRRGCRVARLSYRLWEPVTRVRISAAPPFLGPVAQLEEYPLGVRGVPGSNPGRSTFSARGCRSLAKRAGLRVLWRRPARVQIPSPAYAIADGIGDVNPHIARRPANRPVQIPSPAYIITDSIK